jgi:hypothetical protein
MAFSFQVTRFTNGGKWTISSGIAEVSHDGLEATHTHGLKMAVGKHMSTLLISLQKIGTSG